MLFFNYSTIYKKKSIQFLFKKFKKDFKNKMSTVMLLINSEYFHYSDVKVYLKYYLGINKKRSRFFLVQKQYIVKEIYFLIKLFTKEIKFTVKYFKKVILIESSKNFILCLFIQDKLKIKKLFIRTFFFQVEELFYLNEKTREFLIRNNH